MEGKTKGNEAPLRPPLEWRRTSFWDEERLFEELERVFDICHGCRRCLTLCPAFSTLFELVDESSTMRLDGVAREDYWRVVERCYLCDLCYATRCPYIPPHERMVDFPHLMLRAKAVRYRKRGGGPLGERLSISPDALGSVAAIPVLGRMVCAAIDNPLTRRLLRVPSETGLAGCRRDTLRRRLARRSDMSGKSARQMVGEGVVLFVTCHGNYRFPEVGEHLIAILEHNAVPVVVVERERCCGMSGFERGDLEGVREAKEFNVQRLAKWVGKGWKVLILQPSCLQLFRRWLPALFPDDGMVHQVSMAVLDPFEFLASFRHAGRLKTDFRHALGVVACHLPCRLRVDGSGAGIRELLSLIPDTYVEMVEGCAGSGCAPSGGGARDSGMGERIRQIMPDHYGSACMLAGRCIELERADGSRVEHPLALLRKAYGI